MLPSLSDYMQTFQNPKLFLSDRELVTCTCPKDQQGQPKVQSGGFALTFKLESPTKKWAVRCFHREVKDRDRRYKAISSKLSESAMKHSGYFVDFVYQDTGVTVKGQKYPIVKMSWAQGVTLGTFLETNYNNPQRLHNLQSALRQLYKFLVSQHIAHGDIQPGNVMVSDDGRKVQLIDYDGMFVPGIEGLKAAETGVPNFQHPSRQKQCPWNDRLDRFPFIMLDVALSVLAEKPSYWTKTNSSDEKVLFETTDYIAPYGSSIFNELKSDVKFSKQISVLQKICISDFDDIPDAIDYISSKPSFVGRNTTSQPQTVSISYQGNYAVLGATDIGEIASHVGDVVEIVGCVMETRDGLTKGYGLYANRPYVFINFNAWYPRVDTFCLVLWSEVIEQFSRMSVQSISSRYTGQYISIVGMIREFRSKYGITYQLVPTSAKQIQIIDKTEADFRLGKIKKVVKQNFGGTMGISTSQSATTPMSAAMDSLAKRRAQNVMMTAQSKSSVSTKSNSNVPCSATSKTKTSTGGAASAPYSIASVKRTNPSAVSSPNVDRLKNMQTRWDGGGKTASTGADRQCSIAAKTKVASSVSAQASVFTGSSKQTNSKGMSSSNATSPNSTVTGTGGGGNMKKNENAQKNSSDDIGVCGCVVIGLIILLWALV